MKRQKKRSEADVAAYWLEHDSVPEIDWSQTGVRLEFDPDIERPTRSITIRLPRRLVQALRVLAKDREIAVLREIIAVLFQRWSRIVPHKRPHYSPQERMRILRACHHVIPLGFEPQEGGIVGDHFRGCESRIPHPDSRQSS